MKLKKNLNITKYFSVILFTSLLLLSCQDEETQITSPEPSAVLEIDSSLTSLISRTISEKNSEEGIDCVDFEYPISISTFNTSFDVTDIEDIDSDLKFSSFLEALTDDIIASINYPITILFADQSSIEIADNFGLEGTLLDVNCTPETKGDPEIIAAKETIIGCTWIMDRYIINEERPFESTADKTFEFFEDETYIFNDSGIIYNGDWDFEKDNNDNLILTLESPLLFPSYIDYDFTMIEFREGFMLWSANNTVEDITIGFEKSCN